MPDRLPEQPGNAHASGSPSPGSADSSSSLKKAAGSDRSWFESFPYPVAVLDAQSLGFISANDSFVRHFGYSRNELLTTTLRRLRMYEESLLEFLVKSFEAMTTLDGTFRCCKKDGSVIRAEISVECLEVAGRPARLLLAIDVSDRDRLRAALADSERQRRVQLDSAPDTIISADAEGRITEINSAGERAFGRSQAELLGQDVADVVVPLRLRERHRRGWAHYMETGERHIIGRPVEMPALRADGTEFPAEIHVSSLPMDGHIHFTAHVRDLTEAKRAEGLLNVLYAVSHALGEAPDLEQAAREIIRAMCATVEWDVGVLWRVDPEAGVLRFVDLWHSEGVAVREFDAMSRGLAFRKGLGLPGTVWAREAPTWIPDVTAHPNFPRARAASKCGLRGAFGFPVRLGGEILAVIEFFSRDVRSPDDGLLEMFRAVGTLLGQFIERKRKEESLRVTSDMLGSLLRESPLAIVHLNRDLTVRFWNPAAERLFGWSEAEMLGRPYPVVVPPERRSEFRRFCDALLRGEQLTGIDTWRVRKDGVPVHIFLSASPVHDARGEVTGLLGIIADLGEARGAQPI